MIHMPVQTVADYNPPPPRQTFARVGCKHCGIPSVLETTLFKVNLRDIVNTHLSANHICSLLGYFLDINSTQGLKNSRRH